MRKPRVAFVTWTHPCRPFVHGPEHAVPFVFTVFRIPTVKCAGLNMLFYVYFDFPSIRFQHRKHSSSYWIIIKGGRWFMVVGVLRTYVLLADVRSLRMIILSTWYFFWMSNRNAICDEITSLFLLVVRYIVCSTYLYRQVGNISSGQLL